MARCDGSDFRSKRTLLAVSCLVRVVCRLPLCPLALIQRAEKEKQEEARRLKEELAGGGKGKHAALKEEDGRRKRKGRHQQLLEEWDDLANEERL